MAGWNDVGSGGRVGASVSADYFCECPNCGERDFRVEREVYLEDERGEVADQPRSSTNPLLYIRVDFLGECRYGCGYKIDLSKRVHTLTDLDFQKQVEQEEEMVQWT